MKKIEFTKKAIVQAVGVGVASVGALLFCVSQRVGIGQTYRSVIINGSNVGCTAEQVDIDDIWKEARREVSLETGERLSAEFSVESQADRKLFEKLLSEDALKEVFKEIIVREAVTGQDFVQVYTVAIDGYRANFTSLLDVKTFLNKVKAASDEAGEYEAFICGNGSNISGILSAALTKADAADAGADVSAGEAALTPRSGVLAELSGVMQAAAANPQEEGYRTGVLDMEFVERVEVYENYVEPGEISDIDEQVKEVTKEKESNKIYVVESGDCLSVIAMDHDTTVSSIVALNGLANADSIRDGQELIIAVPEPDLKIRLTMGEVYEEDYTEEPVVIKNDSWYTTREVVHTEGSAGHRERNDVVVYENGVEISRELLYENILVEAQAAVIEQGTIVPPTYIKPLAGGRYTSGFGRRWGRMHKGVDWACPVGTTVYASCAGTVIQASYNGGYGNNVVISHADGRLTRYAHNSKLLVRVGQHVEQGEAIALSGNTGRSTGPHVHFEIYINGGAVNPLEYISY